MGLTKDSVNTLHFTVVRLTNTVSHTQLMRQFICYFMCVVENPSHTTAKKLHYRKSNMLFNFLSLSSSSSYSRFLVVIVMEKLAFERTEK